MSRSLTSQRRVGQLGAWLLGLGGGLLLGRFLPLFLPSLGLLALGAYLLQRPERSRRVPVQGSLLFLLGAVLVVPFSLPSAPQAGPQVTHFVTTSEQARAWASVRRLVVRNSAGDVEVSGGELLRLEAIYRHGSEAQVPAELLSTYAAGRLSFTGLEPALPQEARRGVQAQLRVGAPRRVALALTGRMGDVSAERLASVQIETNIGDISVREVAGTVIASADVGDVVVSEVRGGTEVNTRVGDLWLEPTPGAAPVLAQTDVGDITLILPRNADARVIATSLSRGLPPNMTRRSPTEGERVFGRGTQLIVLETRIGKVKIISR